MTALEYLEKQFSKTEKNLFYAINQKGTTEKQLNDLKEKLRILTECIEAVENYKGNENNTPIPWNELYQLKAKPVYIKEKAVSSGEWFGWWDILDEVTSKYIRTAYSEEMQKSSKGITWNIYYGFVK